MFVPNFAFSLTSRKMSVEQNLFDRDPSSVGMTTYFNAELDSASHPVIENQQI
jgi:hypothetical protein